MDTVKKRIDGVDQHVGHDDDQGQDDDGDKDREDEQHDHDGGGAEKDACQPVGLTADHLHDATGFAHLAADGGDREPRRHAVRAEHPRHLRDVRALAPEQLAHVP